MRLSVKKAKNLLLSCCYRPPKDITGNLTAYLSPIFQRVQNEKKKGFIIVDFNLNCLNDNEDINSIHFYHKVFELRFILPIDKPTRVCKNNVTITENILPEFLTILKSKERKGIIKSDISDHFPIIFTIQTRKIKANDKYLLTIKENEQQLSLLHWRHVSRQKDVNKITLLRKFLEIYETNFTYKQVTVKPKDVKNPWMIRALKSSIQKQKLN